MTTQAAVDVFKVLQDKYGAPEIIDNEIVKYLNMGMYEWLNRLVPDNQGGIVNFEFDSNVAMNIKPFILDLTLTMNSDDKVTDEDIADEIRSLVNDQNAEVFRVLNVGVEVTADDVTTTYPAKYVKHNNLYTYQRNYFKRSSSTTPLYTIVNDGYQFYPTEAGNIKMTVIKMPTPLCLTPTVVNPELTDYNMYSVIMIALKLAGIATRDTEIIEDIRLSALQVGQ